MKDKSFIQGFVLFGLLTEILALAKTTQFPSLYLERNDHYDYHRNYRE